METLFAMLLTAPVQVGVAMLLTWGIGPGVCVRLASLCYLRSDARRRGIVRALYRRSLLEQPVWAIQQLERGVAEGLPNRFRRRKASRGAGRDET